MLFHIFLAQIYFEVSFIYYNFEQKTDYLCVYKLCLIIRCESLHAVYFVTAKHFQDVKHLFQRKIEFLPSGLGGSTVWSAENCHTLEQR